MAVDLYCYIERHEDARWRLASELVPYDERRYDPEAPELAPSYVHHSVDKELASILVDTGWAIRAAEPYTAVVSRRGKPEDLCPELDTYFRYFDDDDATVYSWFTASELSAFDLSSRMMTRQAYVPHDAAHLFEDCPVGFPLDQWPKDDPVSIAGWSRDGTEVPPALAAAGAPDATRVVVQANW